MSGQQTGVLERLAKASSPNDLEKWPKKDDYYVTTCRVSKDDVPSLIDVALKWGDPDWPYDDVLPGVDPNRAALLPVTAWRTLADLRAEEAVEPLVDLVRSLDGDLDEWMLDDLPLVFAKIGKSAFDPLAELARDRDFTSETRSIAVAGLAEIAKAHPEVRDDVVEILTEILAAREDDVELNSNVLVELVELNASEAAEVIERAFSENRVDVGAIGDWDEVRRQLGVEGLGLSMPEHPVNSIEGIRRGMGIGIFSKVAVFPEEVDYEAADEYYEKAGEAFSKSPEAQQIRDKYGDIGWYQLLLEFGVNYLGEIVDGMTLGSVREFVLEYVPRKVSTEPSSAPEIIEELTKFWQFLGREYNLPQAKEIVDWLSAEGRSEELEAELADERNFGMAKSMMMMGQAAGFDMTTQEGLNEFLLAYNSQLRANRLNATTPPADASPPRAVSPPSAASSGTARLTNDRPRRNDPCPCGSGKKYKKCCGRR